MNICFFKKKQKSKPEKRYYLYINQSTQQPLVWERQIKTTSYTPEELKTITLGRGVEKPLNALLAGLAIKWCSSFVEQLGD